MKTPLINRITSIGLILAAGALVARAEVLTWDPALSAGANPGGAGTWNFNGTANWFNGVADVKWTENSATGTNSAVFSGAAGGVVTLNTSLSASNLTFYTPGYTIAGSGTLMLGGGGIDAINLSSGTTTIGTALNLVGSQQMWQSGNGGILAINGAVTRATGAAVDFSPSGITSSTLVNDAGGILGGWATVGGANGTGGDWAANDGSGNVITYAGYTDVTGSQAITGAATQNWRTIANTVLTNSATINSLNELNDFAVNSGVTLTLGSGGLILGNISRWMTAGSTTTSFLTSGLITGELFVHTPNPNADATNWRLWPRIADNGATPVKLIKDGAGYVALANNNNTYSGGTLVNAGILGASETVTAPASIAPFGTGIVTVKGGQLQLGTSPTSANGAYYYTNDITVNGATLNVWDSAPHLLGTLAIGAAGATIGSTFNGGGAELDKGLFIEGLMTGSGPVTIQHSGLATGNTWNTSIVFITNNANTYSGTITVMPMSGANGGSYLGVSGSNALANATIDLSNGNNTSSGLRFGNSPLVLKTGMGTAALGALTGTANVVLTGYNAAGNPHAYGTDPITLAVGNNGLSTTYSGILSGLGGLTKVGAGTLTLSGANTYTGNTVVNGGSLVLSGGSLASTNYIVARGATLDVSALGSLTLSANQTLASGGTVIGAVNTASGTKIYAGTDGGYGTNKLNNNLTLASGAQVNFDLGTLSNGSNDLMTVAGTLTVNNNSVHIKAPSTLDSLQAADYVLMTSPNPISGSFATAPTWDVAPVNAAHYSIVMAANTVTLHYSAIAGPTGVGSATPSPTFRNQKVLITVTTTDGTAGTVNSVVLDASPIGGSSTLALVSAGGHVWTNTVTVAPNTPAGSMLLAVSLTDTVPLSSLVNIPLTVTIANDVWNGLAANDSFSSNLNWTNQLAPGYVGDSLQFAGTTRLTPSMDNNYTVTSLLFAPNADSFTIGTANSSTLTLAGSVTNNSVNAQTLNVPVVLDAAQTIHAAAGNITLGGVVSGTGSITKTGNNALTMSATGNSLTGTVSVQGGTVNITGGSTAFGTGRSDVGYRANSGNLNITGGSFTTGGGLGVGYSDLSGTAYTATGTVTIANATVSVGSVAIARGNNNQNTVSGTVTLNSGGTLNSEGDVLLGFAGNNNLGKIVVNGGTLNVATTIIRWMILGQWDTSQSQVDVNSGQVNINGNTAIRFATGNNTGTNTFNLNGGAVTFYSDTATTIGGSGVLDLHQGTGATVVNTFNLNGGTLTVPGILSANVAGSRTFNFNGGTLKATDSSAALMNLGTGNAVANVRNGGAIIDSSTASVSIDSALVHSTVAGDNAADGGLTKLGDGTLTLTAVNTYNGATKINTGTLALSGSATINNSSNILVASGAIFDVSGIAFTLGGSQSLLGSGNNNGPVSTTAGSKIYGGTDGGYGTNTFNSDLTLVSGAAVYLDLGTMVGGSNDQIVVTGTLTANGNSLHIKAPSTSVGLDAAADYVLITSPNPISGTIAKAPVWEVAPANAGHYYVTNTGNDIVLHYDPTANAPLVTKASANPTSALRNGTVLLSATITPGSAPISTVAVDLSVLGGSTISLVQSNASNVYTNAVTIPPTASANSLNLTVTVTDSAAATGSADISLTITTSSEVWSGAGVNQNWSTNPNWKSGSAPGYAGDGIVFADALGLAPNMDYGYSITGLSFSNNASSFTIGSDNGSTLTLTANGIINNSANAQTVNVPVVLAAPQTISAAAGNVTVSQPLDNGGNLLTVSGAANTTVSVPINGAGGLTKTGAGTLTLAADNTYSGATTVNGGVVTLSGNLTSPELATVGSAASNNAVLNLAGGNLVANYDGGAVYNSSINVGAASGAAGALKMSSGTFTVIRQLAVGLWAPGGYGVFNQTGGATTIGGFLAVGGDVAGGVINQSGGTVDLTNASVTLGFSITTSKAVMNLSGNAAFNVSGTGNGVWPGEIGAGILNVSGNAALNITNGGVRLGLANAAANGTANLLGGITTVNMVDKGTGSGTLNFNGGTLKANVDAAAFVNGLDGAYVYSAGGTIDDGGFTVTVPQALLAPVGYGVVSIPVSSGGAGYIDTPVVTITNITGTGSGVTAVANVSGGVITSITITSSGHDYGSGDILGVALVGGGGSGAVLGTPVLVANTSGGLTKKGAGTLTLSGANTYAGSTVVNAGTLELTLPTLATNSSVTVAGGAFLRLSFTGTNRLASLVLNGVSQLPGVYNSTTGAPYIIGTGSLLLPSPGPSGPGYITNSVSGNTLTISWPADQGWVLQMQTNSLVTGLGTNWVDVPGSSSISSTNITLDSAMPTVFYRLKY